MAGAFYAIGVCDSDCGSGLPAVGNCAVHNMFDCEVVSREEEKIICLSCLIEILVSSNVVSNPSPLRAGLLSSAPLGAKYW